MVAMDCSLANGHPSKKGSLHYLAPNQPREDDAASIGGVTSRSMASKKSRAAENVGSLSRMIKQARGIRGEQTAEQEKMVMNEY